MIELTDVLLTTSMEHSSRLLVQDVQQVVQRLSCRIFVKKKWTHVKETIIKFRGKTGSSWKCVLLI